MGKSRTLCMLLYLFHPFRSKGYPTIEYVVLSYLFWLNNRGHLKFTKKLPFIQNTNTIDKEFA